ncbi:MAG TPA: DMT family transporter [Candidatus Blautia faecigallinarum]|uniref:DMT family transporter n=1 Tax=Candidatus Blautia faecigallinarum TaxID=2838488 RepID=A0A9D2DQP6_9FIRM|nr:DMT family transporter [Candidatus Blautia faecigallinarum]
MAFVLTLAFVNGCATVISKMINYRCTKHLGTNNGSLVNYVVASVLSLILLLVSSRFSVDLYAFKQAPWWLYLGGAFGIVAFIISMITLSHLKVMESTILLLVGQLTAGILFDAFVFQNISAGKLFGIVLVAAGIIWDNKISSSAKEERQEA